MPPDIQWEVNARGIQGGQVCVNRWFMATPDDVPSAQPAHLAAQMYNIWGTYWRPLVHSAFSMLEFHVTMGRTGTGIILSSTYAVDEAGTYTTAQGAMAPHDTILMWKFPDNANIDPPGEQAFKPGKISFAGVPEDSQENGLIDPTDLAAWNTLGEQLESINCDPGGANYQVDLWMLRRNFVLEPPNPNRAYAPVLETSTSQFVGTQNRRKR